MKTNLCLLPVITALALAWVPAAQAEDFYVRIEFLLGISGTQISGPGNPFATLNDPVVAGFSYSGQPFFLSILVTQTKPATEIRAGGPGRKPSLENAVAPLPVERVEPKVPENVDPSRIKGDVVLKVTVDENGKVADIQILKSLQPDLDRETIKAVSEWTFEPTPQATGEDPAAFVLSFRFRPPSGETSKKRRTALSKNS